MIPLGTGTVELTAVEAEALRSVLEATQRVQVRSEAVVREILETRKLPINSTIRVVDIERGIIKVEIPEK